MAPEGYWQVFADAIIHRIHLRVLRHIRGLAEADLELRGPGEFLGARQSGAPMLRFADLETDGDLLEAARDMAERLLAEDQTTVERHLARWMHSKADYLKA